MMITLTMTVDIFTAHDAPHKNMHTKKVSKFLYIYIYIYIYIYMYIYILITIDKISRLKKFSALQLPNHTKN